MTNDNRANRMNSTATPATPLYAAIEAGGTKFVCTIAHDVERIVEETVIRTRSPESTLSEVQQFLFSARRRLGALSAIGLAAFGPVDLDENSADFGRLRVTPKDGWSNVSFLEPLRAVYPECPIAVDTDVNAAVIAEAALGAAMNCESAVYVTVGTGIGGGALLRGETIRGVIHPEMGHIHVRRHPQDLDFAGVCSFHKDCVEGLASGPAIQARWGHDLTSLGADHEASSIIGFYLGQLAGTILLTLAPQRIVFGGGVLQSGFLLAEIRLSLEQMLNGYHHSASRPESMGDRIRLSSLDGRAGILGALMLAQRAAGGRTGN